MDETILVTGAFTPKGSKIINFLQSRGVEVIGVDKKGKEEDSQASKLFRLDLRHQESIKLLLTFCHPTTLIFCWEGQNDPSIINYSLIALWSLLAQASFTKVILVNNTVEGGTILSLMDHYLLILVEFFQREKNYELSIINEADNLLKSIKEIIIKGGE